MKLTSKRLVSILLCLAFVLAMLPMAVMAAGTYTVAGEVGLCGVAWDPTSNAMTANGDGTYSITFANIAAGTYQFKVTDGSWANSWGLNGGSDNNKVAVETACDVTITFNPETKETTCTGTGVAGGIPDMVIDYIIAVGAGANGFLNDASWDPAEVSNKMTNNNGVYTITYEGVAAGTYEFKFAANGSWSDSWGNATAVESGVVYDAWYNGQNFSLTVAEDDSDVTLTLDLTAMDYKTGAGAKASATVLAPGQTPVDPPAPEVNYYVAGNVELTGYAWDAAGAVMTALDDGTYTITFAGVAAGNHEFKITDGTWDNSWGLNGGNYKITVETTGDVTITFNPADGSVAYTGAIETPAAPITYTTVYYKNSSNWTSVNVHYWGSAAGDTAWPGNAMTDLGNGYWSAEVPADLAGKEGVIFNGEGGQTANLTLPEDGSNCYADEAWTTYVAPVVNHDVKWQLAAGTTAESETTELRLVSWVSSLDMAAVTFNVSIDGAEATALDCTAVYSAIKVDGLSVDNAAEVFGNDEAAYFVTYTIGNIPNADFGAEIQVSVSWTDAEGNTTTSEARTIVVSDAL